MLRGPNSVQQNNFLILPLVSFDNDLYLFEIEWFLVLANNFSHYFLLSFSYITIQRGFSCKNCQFFASYVIA